MYIKLTPHWLKQIYSDVTRIRQMRFAIGIAITAVMAYSINWPLSFLFPIFTCLLLSLPVPQQSPRQLYKSLINTLKGMSFGLFFSIFLIKFPVIFLLFMFTSLFGIYYYLNRGGSFWLSLISMLSLLILPMITITSEKIAIGFSFGFVGSAWAAMLFVYVLHFVLPDPQQTHLPESTPPALEYSPIAANLALKSTLAIFPIVAFCISFQRDDLLLTMIFAAIFTLKPELNAGKEAGKNSLLSTLIGGAIAYVFYWAIVAVPLFSFFSILMFGIALYAAINLFSTKPTAKYFGSAMTCIIVLINGNLGVDSDFMGAFLSRIFFITLAIIYIVAALYLLDKYLPKTAIAKCN